MDHRPSEPERTLTNLMDQYVLLAYRTTVDDIAADTVCFRETRYPGRQEKTYTLSKLYRPSGKHLADRLNGCLPTVSVPVSAVTRCT